MVAATSQADGTGGTPDPRVQAVTALVARVDGAARWLAWAVTRAAVVGTAAGAALWWFAAGERVSEWWRGSAGSLLVLALCLAPALWLVNVRMSLLGLVELPATLSGVATRRLGRARAGAGPRPPAPGGGVFGTVRSLWRILQDYGDVAGSWGSVAQLLAPAFWVLTVLALLAVPLVTVLALVAVLVESG